MCSMKKQIFPLMMAAAIAFSSCGSQNEQIANNPLLEEFNTPFGAPPFDKIKNSHFKPAFEEAFKQHNLEIEAIVKNTEEPTFENTILALENAGELLSRVSTVFGNLNSAHTNDSLKALSVELAPIRSAHSDNISLNDTLFLRVKSVYENRESFNLNPEQMMLLEKTYKSFVRNGANLSPEDKEKMKKINSQLSTLSVQFGQNLLEETNAYSLVITDEADLAGLPDALIAAGAEEAKSRGEEGKWIFTLQNPSVMPFLQYADNRELRKDIWNAYQMRGNNGNEFDNNKILVDIANLRLERANLLGYA